MRSGSTPVCRRRTGGGEGALGEGKEERASARRARRTLKLVVAQPIAKLGVREELWGREVAR